MAAARIFMFGSRDVWFVVGLPVYLYSFGWQYMQVAGFFAAWTIGYGAVQALAPAVVTRSRDGLSREVPPARAWGADLTVIPAVLALLQTMPGVPRPDLILVVGLLVFGFVFASEGAASLAATGTAAVWPRRPPLRLLTWQKRPTALHRRACLIVTSPPPFFWADASEVRA